MNKVDSFNTTETGVSSQKEVYGREKSRERTSPPLKRKVAVIKTLWLPFFGIVEELLLIDFKKRNTTVTADSYTALLTATPSKRKVEQRCCAVQCPCPHSKGLPRSLRWTYLPRNFLSTLLLTVFKAIAAR